MFEILKAVRASRAKRLVAAAIVTLCLFSATASAAGVGDLLSLLKTITSTLQGTIGGALSEIQTLNSAINDFRQQVIWPVAAINQARGFVNSTRAQYGNLMSQIHNVRNNSATLVNPSQLETIVRSGQAPNIAQLQRAYTAVYTPVPSATDARPIQRDMVDMDDALAMASLKTTVISDQTTQGMLALADSLEQQSSSAAPGSGPMLAAQAQVADLETQAYIAKVLAAELRQEAAKLAHQNTLLKQSASSTRNLLNQIQQVLTYP
ncbi:MAG: hypothetical protein ACRD20_07800 [Terriglobales bacterium]